MSVIWVIFFVLLLTVLLDRLLFTAAASRDGGAAAGDQLGAASWQSVRERKRGRGAEFDRKTGEARAELYRQMDEMRRTAMTERAAILARTRAEAEAQIAAASAKLQAEAEEARRRLSAEADTLGAAVAERILGRKAS